ncbi:MAG TPA: gamma-glutamyltransferase, partial [Terriglobales bacterium]|nr:gamma-glutamyltransferase [Terriglobales bacterium]
MHQVMGRRWMVAAGHPLAAQAAARILEAGGNAIDAGVAAGFMLGVVHPDMVSFAGVAPILVHLGRTGETFEVSGVGPYPKRATAEFFREKCDGQIPVGLLRTVVPASPDAWCAALERWGTKSFGETVAPAMECAEHGFPVSVFSAYQLGRAADKIRRFPTSAAVYLKDGQGPPAGHLLVEAELAQTIKIMVAAEAKSRARGRAGAIRAARDAFYKGEIAQRIADYHAREGGLLTTEDLAEFSVEIAPALRTSFGEYEVASCGFWCQGPVLLQMLNLIESYDWRALGHNSPRALHILTEAMKLAFADREAYYGDPLHVKVPADGLLSKEYAKARRALIREDRAWPDLPPAGDPWGLRATANGGHGVPGPAALSREGSLDTSYVCVVDSDGNAFSATPSDPGVDSPLIPGVGCVVSPRGSQGWLAPGHPSIVAPGKRPRLTPAPAMVLRDGRAFMPVGTPGGDVQQQAMLQVFLNVTAHGMAPQQAVEAPRIATRSFPDSFWPHAHAPGVLEAESRLSSATRASLAALGHSMAEWPDWDWRA